MATVGAYEAKTRFSKLLERVERGERIVITKHGTPVAVLQPVEGAATASPEEAIAALKAFRRGRRLNADLRELLEEGRQ